MSAGIIAFMLSGCNDEVYSPIENGVYLSEASPTNTHNQQTETLLVDDGEVVKSLTARMAKATDKDVTVSFELDASLIEKYNEANGTSYQMLPEEFMTFGTLSAVIPAGRVSASPVELAVKPYTTPNAETYAIAVRMKVVSGDLDIVGNADHMIYLLTSPNKQKAAVIRNGTLATDFADVPVTEWTVEFWFRVDNNTTWSFPDAASWEGESNIAKRRYIFPDNAAPISFNTGSSSILLRFWADGVKKIAPTYQCQLDGAYFDSNEWWYPDTWYHIAYTYDGSKLTLYKDGVEDKSLDVVKSFTFNRITFGQSCGNYMKNEFAQIRLWSKCLSPSSIKDGMSRNIPGDSDGLFAYWKCDEGDGKILHDSGPHGIDIDFTRGGNLGWSDAVYNYSHPNGK